jgi:hypothetical protein
MILKGFNSVLVLNFNLIWIQTKVDTFYMCYKTKAIHQRKNKCNGGMNATDIYIKP